MGVRKEVREGLDGTFRVTYHTCMATDAMLNKINALLNKAESTDFGPEAEALIAKATALMAKRGITMAMLADAKPQDDKVEDRILTLNTYLRQQDGTVNLIAKTFGIKMVSLGGGRYDCIGFASDLDTFFTLVTSLNLQLDRHLQRVKGTGSGQTRVARRSFATGFMSTVATRVRRAYAKAAEDIQETRGPGSKSVAVVLASRAEQTEAKFKDKYPRVRTSRRSYRGQNYSQLAAGAKAGTAADIGQGRIGGSKAALNA